MPRISQPYFNLHQIVTGKYTSGNEFVLRNGEDYVGLFHILPTGQRFSGSQPEPLSVELFEKRFTPTLDILRYNQITESEINRYIPPILFYPQVTDEDYKRGKIQRFFVQKRNSPLNTIMEIDGQQYNSINNENNPGINGVIWNKLLLEWRISKIEPKDASYLNELEVQKSIPKFPYIQTYLTNFLEFYR
jgi:hypothetical protein